MTITQMNIELDLFRKNLDWIKTKDFRSKDAIISHYEKYFAVASTHTPLINEQWNDVGVFRHGPKSIRGTNSEMLTAFCCAAIDRWEVHQVPDKVEQNYGVDLIISQGVKREKISVKTTKPKNVIGAQLDTRLTLYKEYFDPGLFRITYLSLVNPETRELWMFNYGALAVEYCDVNERQLCTPKFDNTAYVFINQFLSKYENTVIHYDLKRV